MYETNLLYNCDLPRQQEVFLLERLHYPLGKHFYSKKNMTIFEPIREKNYQSNITWKERNGRFSPHHQLDPPCMMVERHLNQWKIDDLFLSIYFCKQWHFLTASVVVIFHCSANKLFTQAITWEFWGKYMYK